VLSQTLTAVGASNMNFRAEFFKHNSSLPITLFTMYRKEESLIQRTMQNKLGKILSELVETVGEECCVATAETIGLELVLPELRSTFLPMIRFKAWHQTHGYRLLREVEVFAYFQSFGQHWLQPQGNAPTARVWAADTVNQMGEDPAEDEDFDYEAHFHYVYSGIPRCISKMAEQARERGYDLQAARESAWGEQCYARKYGATCANRGLRMYESVDVDSYDGDDV
jgi:hypothetical protein